MVDRPANPQKTAIPTAPAWMNPAQKREYSTLLALETAWKGFVTATEAALMADYVDQRSRLDGLRKLMRSAMRKKDAALAVSLNSQINATQANAERLAGRLQLANRERAIEKAR